MVFIALLVYAITCCVAICLCLPCISRQSKTPRMAEQINQQLTRPVVPTNPYFPPNYSNTNTENPPPYSRYEPNHIMTHSVPAHCYRPTCDDKPIYKSRTFIVWIVNYLISFNENKLKANEVTDFDICFSCTAVSFCFFFVCFKLHDNFKVHLLYMEF